VPRTARPLRADAAADRFRFTTSVILGRSPLPVAAGGLGAVATRPHAETRAGARWLRRIELVTASHRSCRRKRPLHVRRNAGPLPATAEERPSHVQGKRRGWVTAEYGMLPRSTHTRTDREAAGKADRAGRRRSSAHRRFRCGPRSTSRRSASGRFLSTATSSRPMAAPYRRGDGGYVALASLCAACAARRPLRAPVAAVSVGIGAGITPRPRLRRGLRSRGGFDVVANAAGELLEVRGRRREAVHPRPAPRHGRLAQKGARELHVVQRAALEKAAATERPARG